MKKILIIGTGGTIASGNMGEGLTPIMNAEQLLNFVPAVKKICRVECIQPFCMDSTNICPEHWVQLAVLLHRQYDQYDGFVICHGTDTMAYTAAALSYLVQGAKKPIILTGAQKPISFDSTDSRVNLTDAVICASSDRLHGVMVVFNGKVIQGTRACKTNSKSYAAFSSINYPYLGVLRDGRLFPYIENAYLDKPVFTDQLDSRVALLKLIPGTKSSLVSFMLEQNDGLIIEAFGVGGLPDYAGNDLLSVIEDGVKNGKTVVLTTQVQNEGSDIRVYQVGYRAYRCPRILEAFDMTTEAVCAKLMWILARTDDMERIQKLFYTPVSNDIFDYS